MSKFSNIWVWAGELTDSGFTVQDALRKVSSSPFADPRFIAGKGILFADSPYTATEDDIYIFADPAGGSITVNLPAGQNKRFYGIKNYASTGSLNVTVVPNGAETIEGQATLVLTKGGAVGQSAFLVYVVSRTDWFIV
jgi:hypothetical protein